MQYNSVRRWIPLGILAGVLAVIFWRLLLGEALFWGLPALQFVPWRAYGFDMLRAGHLPLWNPYNGAGTPLMANYQSAFLYPLNWLSIFFPSQAALGWWLSVLAVIHLFSAGLGMWLFIGRLQVSELGRGLSVLAFALTTYIVGRLGTYSTLGVAAWIPFLLWSVHGVIVNGRRRDIGWLGMVVGLMLTAGHAQTTWYGLLVAGFYTIWLVIRHERAHMLRAGAAFFGVIVGIMLAGMQLLATADYTLNSQRSGGYGDEELALAFSYSPARTVNFLMPNIFGNPGDGSYLPRDIAYENGVYVGLIPLISAWAAIFAWFRNVRKPDLNLPRYRSDVPFWLMIVVVGFVLALGQSTPLYPFLYRHVPTFDIFQAPVRWHIWTVLGLSVLAGIGVDSWGSGNRAIFWTRLITAGAVGGGVLALFSPLYLSDDLLALEGIPVLVRAIVLTSLWVALAGILTLLKAENVPERFQPLPERWESSWVVVVLLVVACDTGWAARGWNPTIPSQFYSPLLNVTPDPMHRGYWTTDSLNLRLYGQRVDIDGEAEFFDVEELGFTPWLLSQDYRYMQVNWETFRRLNLPNMNLLDRRYLLNNFDPLQLSSYAIMTDLIPTDEQLVADGALALELDMGVNRLYLEDRVDMLSQAGERAILDGAGEVIGITDHYNETVVTLADVETETTLWLMDMNTLDWQVIVNDEPAFINNSIFQARLVTVPPGDSVVRFIYRPWWVLPGATVSAVGLAIWLVLMLFSQSQTHRALSEE